MARSPLASRTTESSSRFGLSGLFLASVTQHRLNRKQSFAKSSSRRTLCSLLRAGGPAAHGPFVDSQADTVTRRAFSAPATSSGVRPCARHSRLRSTDSPTTVYSASPASFSARPTCGPKGSEHTDPSPVDRGKQDSTMHILSDRSKLPPVVGISTGNTHDSQGLKPVLVGLQPSTPQVAWKAPGAPGRGVAGSVRPCRLARFAGRGMAAGPVCRRRPHRRPWITLPWASGCTATCFGCRRSALLHPLEVVQRQLVGAAVRRAALCPGEEGRVHLFVRGAGGRVLPVGGGDLGEVGGRRAGRHRCSRGRAAAAGSTGGPFPSGPGTGPG